MIEDRFVQQVADCCPNTEFRQIEVAQQIAKCAGQAHEVGAEAIKEDLAGKEA
ncbi:hypothetical protein [Muribaculum intestinale]|uniref:hypothetical protein n=1 Tax=Muribaculum intestinale TaxID=1796646 RepID=UPI0025A6522C|nr:hypothetical protein [Muribaculum intestinale]